MLKPRRIVLIATALLLGLFFVAQSIRWSGISGAERAHRKFLGYLEDRRWSKCHGMISSQYGDRWGFDREDISLALQDIGGQFMISLIIDWTTKRIDESAQGFTVVGTARMDGRGGPGAQIVLREVNALAAQPFSFIYQREGLWPWKWRLRAIDHPTAEVPSGYTPGDLGAAASARF